jgi:hypothetical protein
MTEGIRTWPTCLLKYKFLYIYLHPDIFSYNFSYYYCLLGVSLPPQEGVKKLHSNEFYNLWPQSLPDRLITLLRQGDNKWKHPPPPQKKAWTLPFIKVKFLMSDVRVCPVLYLFGLRDATMKKWDVWAPQVTSKMGGGWSIHGKVEYLYTIVMGKTRGGGGEKHGKLSCNLWMMTKLYLGSS